MTVMEEVFMEKLSDAGSTPARSTKTRRYEPHPRCVSSLFSKCVMAQRNKDIESDGFLYGV